MYTLLIVDDEPRQVKALADIIGKMWPQFRVVEAMDAESAWAHIQATPVDAVLTDIRMPGMDGLSLVEQIAAQYSSIKTVLISGYGQFEYAKKAIEHGVVEYLVKPIGLADIKRVVGKLIELLDRESHIRRSESAYRDRQGFAWLTGKLEESKRAELLRTLPPESPGVAVILEAGGGVPDPSQRTESAEVAESANHAGSAPKDRGAWETVLARWDQSLAGVGRVWTFPDETAPARAISLVWLNAKSPAGDIAQRFERLRAETAGELRAGIGELRQRLTEEARDAYEDARLALAHRFYREGEPLLRRSVVKPFAPHAPRSWRELAEPLKDAVRRGERARAMELLSDYYAFRGDGPLPEPSLLKEEAALLFQDVLGGVQGCPPEEAEALSAAKLKPVFEACGSCGELRLRLKRALDRLLEAVAKAGQDKNGQLIVRCQRYLQEHYMEELTLESVAQRLHFNPSYFSSLFKQKTGVNFSDYVLELRIRSAQRMLENTDDRIAEISERVGFRNATYFNKMFKRYTGVSPNAFRRLNGKGAIG